MTSDETTAPDKRAAARVLEEGKAIHPREEVPGHVANRLQLARGLAVTKRG